MHDLNKSIAYVERGLFRGLERRVTLPKGMPKPSIRAWRAPVTASDMVYPEQVFRPKDKPKDKLKAERDTSMTRLALTARALKVTIPLDAAGWWSAVAANC